MRFLAPLVAAAALAALTPPAAAAATGPFVRSVGIRGHAAFVRATVGFGAGTLSATAPRLTDPDPSDGAARLAVTNAGIATTAATVRRNGLRFTREQAGSRVRIRLGAAGNRFKYVAYRVLHAPERLLV